MRAWYAAMRRSLAKRMIPIIDASNVSEYLEALPTRRVSTSLADGDEFLPPWPACWVEFPPRSDLDVAVDSVGVLVTTKGIKDFGPRESWTPYIQGAMAMDGAELLMSMAVFCWSDRYEHPWSAARIFTPLSADGRLVDRVTDADGQSYVGFTIFGPEEEIAESEHGEWIQWFYETIGVTVLFAFQFANCRNVDVVEVLPTRQQRRASQRSGEPIFSHYVLEIDANTQRKVYPKGLPLPSHKRLHICRGHFATYTEDAPLFGKLTGRFWVPAHVRGTVDAGVVTKDYRLKLAS